MASPQVRLRAPANAYAAAERVPVRTQMLILVAVLGLVVVGYLLATLLFYCHFLRPAAPRELAERVRIRRASLASTLASNDAAQLESGDLEKLPHFTEERL